MGLSYGKIWAYIGRNLEVEEGGKSNQIKKENMRLTISLLWR